MKSRVAAIAAFLPLAIAAAALPAAAFAQAAPAKKDAVTVEQRIRDRFEQKIGERPTSVTRMPFGLWEVVIGTDVLYVDANVDYVFDGRVIDTRTRTDITQIKRDDLLRVDVAKLPLDQAIKQVRGDGSRVLITFEDPNCGYCKQFARVIAQTNNVTVYTFLYPILSQDSFEKSRAVWCSKDRLKAWNGWMLDGKLPEAAPPDCRNPLQQVLALGQKLDVSATPTLIFANGRRVAGALPHEDLEKLLVESQRK